jgi:hypothetical protein
MVSAGGFLACGVVDALLKPSRTRRLIRWNLIPYPSGAELEISDEGTRQGMGLMNPTQRLQPSAGVGLLAPVQVHRFSVIGSVDSRANDRSVLTLIHKVGFYYRAMTVQGLHTLSLLRIF